jgi:murein DD-endopeptidase MepM/ murein hydrolase activator NlpD
LSRGSGNPPMQARTSLFVLVSLLVLAALVSPTSQRTPREAGSTAEMALLATEDASYPVDRLSEDESAIVRNDSEPGGNGLSVATPVSSQGGAAGGPGPLLPFSYIVEPGDSLAAIAQQFGIDVPTLIGSNDLGDPDLLPAGTQLNVLPTRGVLYRVVEGDTLNLISQRYEVAVLEILRANDLHDSELIAPGQKLVVPGAKPIITPSPGPAATKLADAPSQPTEASQGDSLPSFVWPASGRITTRFGYMGWASPHGHAGLDIAAPSGTPVAAATSGKVLLATHAGGGYGIQIILDHGGGLRTVYAHLSQLNVETGERVSRGQIIGLVGSTGFSTGPHLHFEVRQNGDPRDPLAFLS